MKHLYIYFYIAVFALLFIFSSCNDWLDVKPRSETRAETLFETEEGFRSALTGVYIALGDATLYGRNTSMYVPDAMARLWKVPSYINSTSLTNVDRFNNTLNKLSNMKFDYEIYEDTENLVRTVWTSYYNCIAQLNNILENLDTSDATFDNAKLIKGEALGLRAFLHLDILRLWGPVPTANVDKNAKSIPYAREMTKDPLKLVSKPYNEVLTWMEQDLNEAEKLLEADPILSYTIPVLNYNVEPGEKAPEDPWLCYRQTRFNYYAVLGTKARLYHWIGKKDEAVTYARKVIEAVNEDGKPKFPLSGEEAYSNTRQYPASLIMTREIIFSVNNPNLQNVIQPLFVDQSATLTQTETALNTAYELTSHNDIRYRPVNNPNRYWKKESYSHSVEVNHYLKYTGNNLISSNDRVPLMRLSEMYFIMMENLPFGGFMPYFQTYRIARGLDISIETEITDETALLLRLEREYRKDFWGEGQMFFFYKKHNYKSYTWPASFNVPDNAYVLPKPKEQMAFE